MEIDRKQEGKQAYSAYVCFSSYSCAILCKVTCWGCAGVSGNESENGREMRFFITVLKPEQAAESRKQKTENRNRRQAGQKQTGGADMEEKRLEAFEKMLAAVQAEYHDILSKMERMKAEGKVKTVTYRQMVSRRTMYQDMISLYQIYGLTE